MHGFGRTVFSVVAFLYALLGAVQADSKLSFATSDVIVNEVPQEVSLSVSGSDLAGGLIGEVRTVLAVPGKRRSKPFANFSHEIPAGSGSEFTITPVYSVPVKTYELSYSARVDFDGDSVWVDAEPIQVTVVDPKVSTPRVLAAFTIIIATIYAGLWLSTYLAVPGYWESVLPKSLHFLLPRRQKLKRA